MSAGQKVKIKCDAYRNGKTFYGQIKEVLSDTQASVIIQGNSKATKFALIWLQAI